jgi:hypothetical protein
MDDRVESKQGDISIGCGQSLLERGPGGFAVGHRQPNNFRHLSNLKLPRKCTIAVSMLLLPADAIPTFGPRGIRKQKPGEKRLQSGPIPRNQLQPFCRSHFYSVAAGGCHFDAGPTVVDIPHRTLLKVLSTRPCDRLEVEHYSTTSTPPHIGCKALSRGRSSSLQQTQRKQLQSKFCHFYMSPPQVDFIPVHTTFAISQIRKFHENAHHSAYPTFDGLCGRTMVRMVCYRIHQ